MISGRELDALEAADKKLASQSECTSVSLLVLHAFAFLISIPFFILS